LRVYVVLPFLAVGLNFTEGRRSKAGGVGLVPYTYIFLSFFPSFFLSFFSSGRFLVVYWSFRGHFVGGFLVI